MGTTASCSFLRLLGGLPPPGPPVAPPGCHHPLRPAKKRLRRAPEALFWGGVRGCLLYTSDAADDM
eukprot:656604-Alexandrium_andersonii.AAC.1